MPMMQRPAVSCVEGGKCWENKYQTFDLKVYVPDNDLDGQTNNYGFRAPLLLVFEEEKQFFRRLRPVGIIARSMCFITILYIPAGCMPVIQLRKTDWRNAIVGR